MSADVSRFARPAWASVLPSEWQVLPIKKIVSTPITDGPHETPEFLDEGVVFISAEAIQDGKIDFARRRGFISEADNRRYSRKYSPETGDIYVVKSGATTGKSAMVGDDTDFNIWSPLAVVRPKQAMNSRFVLHTIRSQIVQDAIAINWSWGTQQNIGMGALGRIQVPVPDLATQRQIADFLDRETARIDLLIEKKQRLVALLGEKLQAEISTLVKKGASDQSIRLRHVARLNPSVRGLRLEPDASVTFCPMEAIHDGVGGIDTSNTRPISEVTSASYNFFAEGDILLAKVTPCFENGKKAVARDLVNSVGFATSEVFVVRVDPQKTSPEYLTYLFSSDDFQYAGRSSMTGAGGLRRISERSILDFPLFVTDRRQQQEIVREIDKEVAISRQVTAKTNDSIGRLKEYRSALITAAVTGQIDVTTYAKSGTPDRRLDAIQEEMGA